MSSHDEHRNDPENEPDANIRALLAELGSGPDGETMPTEVTARLDDTLARLVAERDTGEPTQDASATVTPLRRRWLPRITAAAAAVVVLGAGGVAASNLGVFGGHGSFDSSDGGASSSKAGSAPESTSSDAGGDTSSDSSGAALPELHAGSFVSEVTSLLSAGHPRVSTPERPALPAARATDGPSKLQQDASACAGPDVSDGAVINQVRYDGAPAVLVVHPERGGRQLVEAWTCAGERRLAATTLTP